MSLSSPFSSEPDSPPATPLSFRVDGFEIRGVLHAPPGANFPVVVGCHGLMSNADSPKQTALADALVKRNIAFYRFHHRGCGTSGGRPEEGAALDARCRDLEAAVRALEALGPDTRRLGLFGSSMGGAVCLGRAKSLGAKAVVAFAAPVRSDFIEAASPGASGVPESVARRLSFDLREDISGLRNVLLFHGDADDVVPPVHALEIFSRIGRARALVFQRGGDHRMGDPGHQGRFLSMAVDWFEKRL